jgi:uncharacterized NAD(P)/FAD-binding protein YdhS
MRVAIVGAGFSGTMVAAQLLRSGRAGEVHLIEKRHDVAQGVAYGTGCSSHLLNVPAGRMSAYPDDPDHFFRWLEDNPALVGGLRHPGDFIPRKIYAQYLDWVLSEAVAARPGVLKRWTDEAIHIDLKSGHALLRLEGGDAIEADRVVLAIGNFPPGHPHIADRSFYASRRYIGDPWGRANLAAIHPEESVLLIGSGLTAVDLVLALKEQGHKGLVHMLSRRGNLPQAHKPADPYPLFLDRENLPCSVREAVRLVREELKCAAEKGADWRPVIDAVRPVTQAIWSGWSLVEQRRFLSKVRPYWETHRHRMAPQVASIVQALVSSGRLVLHAGRLASFSEDGDITAGYVGKDGSMQTVVVQHVINCTGPECDYRRMRHPLAVSLVGQGLIRPDELGLGLETDQGGALIDAHGRASTVLFTLGPLRKGMLWETTAVPEIRVQAGELASLMVDG